MAAKPTKPSILDKLPPALRKDAKKAMALALLGVVLIGLWGKMIFFSKTPSGAEAAQPPADPSQTASAAVSANPAAPSAVGFPQWVNKPIVPLTRNLFVIPLDYYPQDGLHPTDADGVPAFWDQLEKSLSTPADQRKGRQFLIDSLRAAAGLLNLQSIIMGGTPKAVIDHQVVAEGDVVAGFRVLKIESRRVIVEREGIRLEIRMK